MSEQPGARVEGMALPEVCLRKGREAIEKLARVASVDLLNHLDRDKDRDPNDEKELVRCRKWLRADVAELVAKDPGLRKALEVFGETLRNKRAKPEKVDKYLGELEVDVGEKKIRMTQLGGEAVRLVAQKVLWQREEKKAQKRKRLITAGLAGATAVVGVAGWVGYRAGHKGGDVQPRVTETFEPAPTRRPTRTTQPTSTPEPTSTPDPEQQAAVEWQVLWKKYGIYLKDGDKARSPLLLTAGRVIEGRDVPTGGFGDFKREMLEFLYRYDLLLGGDKVDYNPGEGSETIVRIDRSDVGKVRVKVDDRGSKEFFANEFVIDLGQKTCRAVASSPGGEVSNEVDKDGKYIGNTITVGEDGVCLWVVAGRRMTVGAFEIDPNAEGGVKVFAAIVNEYKLPRS